MYIYMYIYIYIYIYHTYVNAVWCDLPSVFQEGHMLVDIQGKTRICIAPLPLLIIRHIKND